MKDWDLRDMHSDPEDEGWPDWDLRDMHSVEGTEDDVGCGAIGV